MNNNRLSANYNANLSKVERSKLYVEINKLLNGPSNIEIKEGRPFIKSLNSFIKGGGKVEVGIQDINGLVLKRFSSLSECAKYLGVTQPTVKNRLNKKQYFLFDNNLVCIIKMVKDYCAYSKVL